MLAHVVPGHLLAIHCVTHTIFMRCLERPALNSLIRILVSTVLMDLFRADAVKDAGSTMTFDEMCGNCGSMRLPLKIMDGMVLCKPCLDEMNAMVQAWYEAKIPVRYVLEHYRHSITVDGMKFNGIEERWVKNKKE